jgi:hypothetical protein
MHCLKIVQFEASNLRRHCHTHHNAFSGEFPTGSALRRSKINPDIIKGILLEPRQ